VQPSSTLEVPIFRILIVPLILFNASFLLAGNTPAQTNSETTGRVQATAPRQGQLLNSQKSSTSTLKLSTQSGQQSPQTAAADKNIEAQKKLARSIFQEMISTPETTPETLTKQYLRVIQQCPDTLEAKISYFRLANLLLYGFSPPRFDDISSLLQNYLSRYPGSAEEYEVKQRLIDVYRHTEKWCESAPQVDETLMTTIAFYARSLKLCGKDEQANHWHKELLRIAGNSNSPPIQAVKAGFIESIPLTVELGTPTQPLVNLAAIAPSPPAPAQAPATQAITQPNHSDKPAQIPSAAKLTAKIYRKKSVKDYVGRNEELKGNGAADSRVRASISAPGSTIVAIHLQSIDGLKATWDTVPGNKYWLIAATSGQETLNNSDGTIHYQLPDGELKFDLWVQDNNAIAGARTTFKLRLEMADGSVAETQVIDE